MSSTAAQPPVEVVSAEALAERIAQRDITVWPQPNVAPTRLGWVDIHTRLAAEAASIQQWATTVTASKIVLIGMGGSSLGPEVLRAAVGSDRLMVLDTTDPSMVASLPIEDSVFLVSSKSGGTLEVRSLLAAAWARVPDGTRYFAVTDPGTELEGIARDRGFAKVFVNDPDIGGRYSVLSYFGLVPAALLGYDVGALLASAAGVDAVAAVRLGQEIAYAAMAGRDKLTITVPEQFAAFGLWIEQLVAESTGKRGVGVVPIPTTVAETGPDRHQVTISLTDPVQLGGEFLRWELATAAMGHVLGIDPFDEPNVTESKNNTKRVLDELANGPLPTVVVASPDDVATWLATQVKPGDYVSVQAYMPYGSEQGLEALRRRITAQTGAATTAGYGPRFLHSTGQLHKGGANNIVSVQIVPSGATADVEVPGAGYSFHTLISAQSIGDLQSLESHNRRCIRVVVDELAVDPFARIC
jgi:Phosphoglucose isomerase